MPSIQELQTAIDQKALDTRQLEPLQLKALDEAFKSGELKGYDGIQDYARLVDLGAMSVASGKEQRMKAFESATGVDRGDMVLLGSAGMAMVPYMKNQGALIDAFEKNGFKDYYGVDKRFGGMADIYGKRFSVLSDALKKLPKVPGAAGAPVRLLANLAGMVDDTVDIFQKFARRGASPALSTEAQSIGMGAIGAFGGSGLYEIANLGSDYVGATNQDLANLTDNQIRQLPFSERLLVNSLTEAQNDILWAGGALSLIPAVRFAQRGFKGLLGLNDAQVKEIAKSYERLGLKPNVAALIPGNNAFQNFFKKFFTTIGVYPIVSGPITKFNKEFNQKLSQEKFLEIAENLDLPPNVNNSIMNYAGANEIKNEWKRIWSAIDNEYGEFRKFYEEIGNPRFIPTAQVREATETLIKRLKESYPEEVRLWSSFGDKPGDMAKLSEFDDPMVTYINYLNDVGRGGNIRISDWLGLSKLQTAAYTGSRYKNVNDQLIVVRSALERDLNSMHEATQRDNLKKIFKTEFDNIATEQGPAAAEAFIDRQIRTAEAAFGRLKEANTFYSMVLRPFEKSKVARKLRAQDAKLFADKGIEMVGTASLAPDEVFDSVIRRVLNGNSPDSVKQLKQLLGLTKSEYKIYNDAGTKVIRTVKIPESKESRAVYDRYVKQFFWDAWNESTQFPLRDLKSLSNEQIAARAREQGFTRPRWMQLSNDVEQRVRAKTKTNEILDVTEVDGRIFTEGNGIANVNEGLIRDHNFGEVDIEKFVKNIGIDTAQGRDKIREIFGGGAKGEKALQKIQDIIDVKRNIDTVEFTDPSKFVQRSLTLRAGSSGGIVAGASAAAFGIGQTLQIILGGRLLGSVLANPKLAEDVMDMNMFYRYLSDDKKVTSIGPQLLPRARTAFARAINSMMENEGDDFRVDPNKIDFEEVQQKLLSLDPSISLNNKFDFNSLPKFTRDRIYPEYETASKLPRQEIQQGEEFLQGANLMAQSDQQFDAIANQNPTETVQQQQPQVASAPQETPQFPVGAAPTTGQPQQRSQLFAALNPQDTLGQLIANQPQQLNEGGLVEDAYSQADEVLNA